jgi:uncharacterized membrane protein YqjE
MSNARPVTQVLQDIVGNVQEIVRSEVRLAKAELREEAVKAKSSGLLLGAGAVIGLYAGGCLLLGIIHALALRMPMWGASLFVGGVLAIFAAILLGMGKNRIREVNPMPERTIDTVKENVEWAKQQTK